MDADTTTREFDARGTLDVLLDITGGDLAAAEALLTKSHTSLAADGKLTNRAISQFVALRIEIAIRRGTTYPAWALREDTPVAVTVIATHRRGYDVIEGSPSNARLWFTAYVWATPDEAAQVAGQIAHDLDL